MTQTRHLDGRDWEDLATVFSPVCEFCAHLRRDGGQTCTAYPDGIPREIWVGENKHRSPHPGDRGTTFKEIEA